MPETISSTYHQGLIILKSTTICLLFFSLVISQNILAKDQCDFKGVRIGDKLSPSDLMKKLGVQKYTLNPNFLDTLNIDKQKLQDKYGPNSIEIEYDAIGPFCKKDYCVIPNNQKIGSVPVNLIFYFENKNELTAINISFQSLRWDEIKKDLFRKYGNNWTTEKMHLGIAQFDEPNKTLIVTREILEHKSGVKNLLNHAECEVRATNYDKIFQHGNRLGSYHGVVDIEKISNGF